MASPQRWPSRAYAVRGLRAFAEAMTAAWTDESRAVEGRPDAQEEAIALYTMHAAKGLEWPIVVPVNTMTQIMAPESAVTDRASGRFYCPVLGVKPTGYEAARVAETAELSERGAPLYLRSDNGSEFVSRALLKWIVDHGSDTALIDPGKPGQNGAAESFNGKFRDECLSLEWFRSRANEVRPHSSLGYLTALTR